MKYWSKTERPKTCLIFPIFTVKLHDFVLPFSISWTDWFKQCLKQPNVFTPQSCIVYHRPLNDLHEEFFMFSEAV